jgi:hypothetical protein
LEKHSKHRGTVLLCCVMTFTEKTQRDGSFVLRNDIYRDDHDRQDYLSILSEVVKKI